MKVCSIKVCKSLEYKTLSLKSRFVFVLEDGGYGPELRRIDTGPGALRHRDPAPRRSRQQGGRPNHLFAQADNDVTLQGGRRANQIREGDQRVGRKRVVKGRDLNKSQFISIICCFQYKIPN